MNAIPWYQSQVLIAAVVAIVSQILVLIGQQNLFPRDLITAKVEALFQLISLGATAWAIYKRASSTVQPVTMTKAGAGVQNQTGFARISTLFVIAVGGLAALLSGCSGTRAAYAEAQSPDEYAFVLLEQYDSLIHEAASLKAKPTTPAHVIDLIQQADLKAQPFVDSLRPLRDAYLASQSAATEAQLQDAINKAVLAIADLIRVMKDARSKSLIGYREPSLITLEVPT